MTNTLENGHWVGSQDSALDNLVENSSTMDRNHNSSILNSSNQQEINGTNEQNDLEDDESIESEIDEEECNDDANQTKKTVPYLYTGHLGTTSPQVLKHIDEAIDNVVKNFTVSKSDLILASTSNQTASTTVSNKNFKTTTTTTSPNKPIKRRRRRKKATNYPTFDTDLPFELNSTNRKKRSENKPNNSNQQGPFIKIDRNKHQTNYIVVNNSSKLKDKDSNKGLNKSNFGSTTIKTKSSNQILFKANDNSWICIFCKRQPHFKQLGDLFGPHETMIDKNLEQTNETCSTQSNHHSSSTNNLNNSTNSTNPIKNEIWFHEDCIIWSNGIYLAGNRVRNIDEVILECCDIVSVLIILID